MTAAGFTKLKPLAPRSSITLNSPSNSTSSAATVVQSAGDCQAVSGGSPAVVAHKPPHVPNLGVPCSRLESITSMDPKDYVWGTPSPQQQQQLYQQFAQMAFFYFLSHQQAFCQGPAQLPFGHFPPVCPLPPAGCFPSPLTPMPGIMGGCPAGVLPIPSPPLELLQKQPCHSIPILNSAKKTSIDPPTPSSAPEPAQQSPIHNTTKPKSDPEASNSDFAIELNVDDIKQLLDEPVATAAQESSPQASSMSSLSGHANSPSDSAHTSVISGNNVPVEDADQAFDSLLPFGPEQMLALEVADLGADFDDMSDDKNEKSFADIMLDSFLCFDVDAKPQSLERSHSVSSVEENSSCTVLDSRVSCQSDTATPKRKRTTSPTARRNSRARANGPKTIDSVAGDAMNALQEFLNYEGSEEASGSATHFLDVSSVDVASIVESTS